MQKRMGQIRKKREENQQMLSFSDNFLKIGVVFKILFYEKKINDDEIFS